MSPLTGADAAERQNVASNGYEVGRVRQNQVRGVGQSACATKAQLSAATVETST